MEARALGDIVSMESDEWRVSVELVQQWRWRCLEEGILVPGSELCVASPGSGRMVGLTESGGDSVPRNELRHGCGSRVLPVTPLEAK